MTDGASIIPLHAVSTYEYDALQDCWSWASPIPVLQYATDGSPLTTEQLLAFVHPDDREPTLAQFLGLLQDRTPYSCLYRLVDSAGVAHPVVNVGTPVVEGDEVTALRGFVVDLTAPLGAHARSAVAAMLPAKRAAIIVVRLLRRVPASLMSFAMSLSLVWGWGSP